MQITKSIFYKKKLIQHKNLDKMTLNRLKKKHIEFKTIIETLDKIQNQEYNII